MRQSRLMSLVEAMANVVVGYGIAVAMQIVVFPMFGLAVSLGQNLAIGLVFTVVSIARSFLSQAIVRGPAVTRTIRSPVTVTLLTLFVLPGAPCRSPVTSRALVSKHRAR